LSQEVNEAVERFFHGNRRRQECLANLSLQQPIVSQVTITPRAKNSFSMSRKRVDQECQRTAQLATATQRFRFLHRVSE
jgi:hypothetical protein